MTRQKFMEGNFNIRGSAVCVDLSFNNHTLGCKIFVKLNDPGSRAKIRNDV